MAKEYISKYDLPVEVLNKTIEYVSIDTETLGLNLKRDRLCLVQMSINNDVYMVSFPTPNYEAPNLKKFLSNKDILKIFHFARFDMLAIYSYLGIMVENVICTKILSKLARTYSDKHSLAALCKEVLGIELNKSACSSYWGNSELTNDQVKYAAADVKYLHSIFQYLHNILLEEKKWQLAQEVLHTLKTLVLLDHNLYDPFVILNH